MKSRSLRIVASPSARIVSSLKTSARSRVLAVPLADVGGGKLLLLDDHPVQAHQSLGRTASP